MPLTVSDAILCEIGRIAVYQSHIEGQMALFIRELLYLNDARGDALTVRMSFGTLVDTLRSLLLQEFGAGHLHSTRFEEIRKELSQREQQRNQIVHSMWSFGSTFKANSATRSKVINTKTSGARRVSTPVTIEELKELSKAMEHLEWAISDLRVRICHYEAAARTNRS